MRYYFMIPGSKGFPWLWWGGGEQGWVTSPDESLSIDPGDVEVEAGIAFVTSGGRMILGMHKING